MNKKWLQSQKKQRDGTNFLEDAFQNSPNINAVLLQNPPLNCEGNLFHSLHLDPIPAIYTSAEAFFRACFPLINAEYRQLFNIRNKNKPLWIF